MWMLLHKNVLLGAAATVGSVLTAFFGGWDYALQTLIAVIAVDYLTGLACALIFRKSPKTANGAGSSDACFHGLVRKAGILLCVLLAVQVDRVTNDSGLCRTAVILFFIGNEGLSIVENLGLMGVPMPAVLKNALEVLRKKGDREDGEPPDQPA